MKIVIASAAALALVSVAYAKKTPDPSAKVINTSFVADDDAGKNSAAETSDHRDRAERESDDKGAATADADRPNDVVGSSGG